MTTVPTNSAERGTGTPSAGLVAKALEAGIRAARDGNKKLARRLLTRVTELDPADEAAWLWLASVAETSEKALVCLQTVLALNPDNQRAREGLRWVQAEAGTAAAAEVCPECGTALAPGQQECPVCALDGALPYGELAPSFVLTIEQAEAIDACLESMAVDSEARCIILADVSGQLIAERGETAAMNTQVLSALAAGELAATHELARLVGERARFKLLLHEGERQSVYLSDLGEQLILVIVFDNDTPIGLVRTVLKQALDELAPILVEAGGGRATDVHGSLDQDFAQLIESELDSSLEA